VSQEAGFRFRRLLQEFHFSNPEKRATECHMRRERNLTATGRIASEEVIIQQIKSKCIPAFWPRSMSFNKI